MNKLLIILGPTATGKTDLALQLASKFQGELISADSRQVYKGLDIGTGKLPSEFQISNFQFPIKKANGYWKINGVNIWMYDVVDPKIQYTVADFVKDAQKIMEEIWDRGKLPIVVGGTGLYIKALTEGLSNLSVPVDKKLRKKLEKLTKEQLQKRLKEISFKKWESMNYSDSENPRRLVRAIELAISLVNSEYRLPRPFGARNDVLRIGLSASREVLYNRVDDHVISRLNQGMIDEAKKLNKEGLTFKRMRQLGLEYGVLADYLGGVIEEGELKKTLQGKIHGFVRRQLTWFKKEKDPPAGQAGVNWFDITDQNFTKKVENLISRWYHSPDAEKS